MTSYRLLSGMLLPGTLCMLFLMSFQAQSEKCLWHTSCNYLERLGHFQFGRCLPYRVCNLLQIFAPSLSDRYPAYRGCNLFRCWNPIQSDIYQLHMKYSIQRRSYQHLSDKVLHCIEDNCLMSLVQNQIDMFPFHTKYSLWMTLFQHQSDKFRVHIGYNSQYHFQTGKSQPGTCNNCLLQSSQILFDMSQHHKGCTLLML